MTTTRRSTAPWHSDQALKCRPSARKAAATSPPLAQGIFAHGYSLVPHLLLVVQLLRLTDAAERDPAPPTLPGPHRKLLAHVYGLDP